MWKIAPVWLTVTLLLVAGCGPAPAPAATGAIPQGTCAGGEIGPLSASFISASDGWLLGVTLQRCWAFNGSRLVVRKTTDAGRHWSPVPAPPAPWSGGAPVPPAAGVSEIYFADARDGWAFGPGLWVTHDGGASWHRVLTHGREVYSVAATDGHAVAAFLRCEAGCYRGSEASFTIETSPDSSDAWRPVPGAAGQGQPDITAAGGMAYALGAAGPGSSAGTALGAAPAPARLLTGPADGTGPWHAHATPCYAIGANTATAVTAAGLVMACALLGAHPATTRLYRTDDSGAHWRQFSTLGLYDGASGVTVTSDGTLLVAGIYDGAVLSYDDGRSWHRPATVDQSPRVGGGGPIDAAMTSDDDGFVIANWGPLWVTSDAGHSWETVIVP